MNSRLAVRGALLQLALVAATSAALALALPHSFFDDWGWLSGPAAWLACAAGTGRLLGLAPTRTLAGAALAGLPSAAFVAVGLHWAGVLTAVVFFAAWCGRFGPREPRWTSA